jgi:uncharacterized protein
MDEAKAIIAKLGLAPHPEGGWYRETWRGAAGGDARARGTAIYFLLERGEHSHWHRVDADELWLWHAGAPLEILVAAEGEDNATTTRLGGDPLAGESAQCLVPAGHWQSTTAPAGWALVSCVVVPGFDFAGFELAPPGWAPRNNVTE